MANNIIDFNAAKNIKKMNIREIGNINITVFLEESTKCSMYYILPNRKELIPIVDLIDDVLSQNSFKLIEELKVKRL